MQAGLHGVPWGSNPQLQIVGVRRSLANPGRVCFDVALRMQVELQPLKLVVAGSNPAGSKSGEP
jgi:hypothetical protein